MTRRQLMVSMVLVGMLGGAAAAAAPSYPLVGFEGYGSVNNRWAAQGTYSMSGVDAGRDAFSGAAGRAGSYPLTSAPGMNYSMSEVEITGALPVRSM